MPQLCTFQVALQFARTEGIPPAPSRHTPYAEAIDEALRCKEAGRAQTILFNLSGHGHFRSGGL